jgi:hypothetical protein
MIQTESNDILISIDNLKTTKTMDETSVRWMGLFSISNGEAWVGWRPGCGKSNSFFDPATLPKTSKI